MMGDRVGRVGRGGRDERPNSAECFMLPHLFGVAVLTEPTNLPPNLSFLFLLIHHSDSNRCVDNDDDLDAAADLWRAPAATLIAFLARRS